MQFPFYNHIRVGGHRMARLDFVVSKVICLYEIIFSENRFGGWVLQGSVIRSCSLVPELLHRKSSWLSVYSRRSTDIAGHGGRALC